jgi:EmrB/QacA subfamily drug resistance transporter
VGPAITPGMAAHDRIDRGILVLSSVVVLGAIMSILDTTIVNVALDTLGRDFHASLSTIQWVTTGYLLALSIVIPLTGWAICRFGAKAVWMMSVTLFLLGSILCGVAWSVNVLIAFRILQGFGGGMIMPVGQAILARAAGPHRMGRVMSIVGVPMLLGPVLGPVIGGLLVEYTTWRWIFFVNVPIGVLALVLAWRLLPRQDVDRDEKLDVRGLALLSPGLALLVYGFSEAGSSGGFGGTRTVVGLTLGTVLIAAFVLHARSRGERALLDVGLFRRRAFTGAAATSFLFGVAIFGVMILLPLYYQVVRGEGALGAGLLMAPQGVGAAMAMPLAGRLTDRIGAGWVVPAGLTIALLGTVAYTQVGPHTSYALLAASLWVRGLGLGSTMMPAMAAAYASLQHREIPRATTSLNIIQRVGGSVGTALLAVVLQREIVAAAGSAGHGFGKLGAVPPAVRAQLAAPLAHGFARTFWLALILTSVAYVPALLLPKHRRGRAPDLAAAGAGSTGAGEVAEKPPGRVEAGRS